MTQRWQKRRRSSTNADDTVRSSGRRGHGARDIDAGSRAQPYPRLLAPSHPQVTVARSYGDSLLNTEPASQRRRAYPAPPRPLRLCANPFFFFASPRLRVNPPSSSSPRTCSGVHRAANEGQAARASRTAAQWIPAQGRDDGCCRDATLLQKKNKYRTKHFPTNPFPAYLASPHAHRRTQ